MNRFLLLILAFQFSALTSFANNDQPFTKEELEELSPFQADAQIRLFKQVLSKMNEEIDPDIILPEIRITESIKDTEIEIIENVKKQGMPLEGLAKGVNMYLFKLNLIILGKNRKLHNLAHEYVHFIQLKYRNYNPEDFGMDFVEMEAIEIQSKFKPSLYSINQ